MTVGAVGSKELRRRFSAVEIFLGQRGPRAQPRARHDQHQHKPSSKQSRLLLSLASPGRISHQALAQNHGRACRFLSDIGGLIKILFFNIALPRFVRVWEFYLAAAEVNFRDHAAMVFQIQLTRRQGVVPMTRDYILRGERRLRAGEGGQRTPLRLAGE